MLVSRDKIPGQIMIQFSRKWRRLPQVYLKGPKTFPKTISRPVSINRAAGIAIFGFFPLKLRSTTSSWVVVTPGIPGIDLSITLRLEDPSDPLPVRLGQIRMGG